MRKIILEFLSIALLLALLSKSAYAQDTYQLSGYVVAEESRESLIGAVVSSGENWAVTNEFGFFSIKLKKGKHIVKCSYVGRIATDKELNLVKDTLVLYEMKVAENLDDAVIIAEAEPKRISTNLGVINIPTKMIEEIPTVLGEPDLFKTIQKMPGVQSGMEGFSGIYIRGGGSDENLILLDGAPIYNSSHLMGLLSTFTPEAIKQTTLYKSSFPAKYGGRTSSVIDVRTKEGNAKSYHGTVSAGLIDGRVYVEGPIFKDRTSFSVSARGMNTLVLYPVVKIFNLPYYGSFYDLTGKVTHRFKNSDQLYLSVYHGQDRFLYSKSSSSTFKYLNENKEYKTGENKSNDEYNLKWGNTTANLHWNHTFGSKLFSELSLSWSNYRMKEESFSEDLYYKEQESGYSNRNSSGSGISDIHLGWDLDMNISSKQSLNFGLSHIIHSFVPQRSLSLRTVEDGESQEQDASYNNENNISFVGSESSIYCEDVFRIGERFNARLGLRGTMFYTSGKFYYSLEPRIAAGYQIIPTLSVKGSYSKMSQYVHLLASGNMSLPTDLWVPITAEIEPVLSDQYSVGVDYANPKGWGITVEAYYKKEKNVLEYKDGHLPFTSSIDWEQTVEMGEGTSKGVELLAQKQAGKLTGMISYTLSKTDRVFPDGSVNSGKPFPFTYDRRHVVNVYANYKFNDKVSLNGAWSFASGNMITASWRSTIVIGPDGYYSVYAIQPYISGRNNYRLPPSHRLDLAVKIRKVKTNGISTWTFGIYNAYGAKNPNWVVNDRDFKMGEDGPEGLYHYLSKRTFLTFLPSFSYTFTF